MVVAGIAIDDVEVVNFVKVMLCSVGGIYAAHTWVKTAAEYGCQTSLLEAVHVSPLPGVFEVCLVLGLVVRGVHIVYPACQAGIHDGEVLIGQCKVQTQLRLVCVEQRLQLLYIVGIHLRSLCLGAVLFVQHLCQGITFLLASACYDEVGEYVRVLGNLVGSNRSDAACTNHENFHFVCSFMESIFACALLAASLALRAFSLRWRPMRWPFWVRMSESLSM